MNAFRLLVTRPLSAAAKAVAMETIRVTEEPFIRVTLLYSEDNRKMIRSLVTEPLTVIFTSRHAVTAVAEMAELTSVGRPPWKIFCIAGTTEKLVKTHFGEESRAASAHYAEELAPLIVNAKPEEKIVFFCGNLRRDTLPDILKKNGMRVQELVVYTTTLTPRRVEEQFDGIAFFSPSAATSFFSANRPDQEVVCFSIGHTTTAALKSLTNNRVITSSTTTETAMIEAVQQYLIQEQRNQIG